jgi:hypothetical protein
MRLKLVGFILLSLPVRVGQYKPINVLPGCTPLRDEFTVSTSEVSPSQVYKDMVDTSLFHSHFFSRKTCATGFTTSVGYAVDRFVGAIDQIS